MSLSIEIITEHSFLVVVHVHVSDCTCCKNPFGQLVEPVGHPIVLLLPHRKLECMLYKYILLLQQKMLSEPSVLNCFISYLFPSLLSIFSDFHVHISTSMFAVLETPMGHSPYLPRT